MASPVILKRLAVSATEAVTLLVVLNTKTMAQQLETVSAKLVLRQKDADDCPVTPPGRDALDRLIAAAEAAWNVPKQRL